MECPIQGPQHIDEENFYKTKIWMHIKSTPTRFINEEDLIKICAPAGKYLKHKNLMIEIKKKKNMECLVEMRVQHNLPFGSEVYMDLFAKPEWLA